MLEVYGHPASQPSRTVIWACVLNALPFKLTKAVPRGESSINSRGQVPVINDSGFVLAEMPAILPYLAEKYGWASMYPDDMHTRARISEYLHAHHSLTRLATTKLMAPHVLVAFGGNPLSNPLSYVNNLCIQTSMDNTEGLASGQQVLTEIFDFIESTYLKDRDFIAGTSSASIADLACFEELEQLRIANLFDFSGNTSLSNWLQRMQDLPYYESIHRYNIALGDIQTQPNTMERFSRAVSEAFDTMFDLEYVHC